MNLLYAILSLITIPKNLHFIILKGSKSQPLNGKEKWRITTVFTLNQSFRSMRIFCASKQGNPLPLSIQADKERDIRWPAENRAADHPHVLYTAAGKSAQPERDGRCNPTSNPCTHKKKKTIDFPKRNCVWVRKLRPAKACCNLGRKNGKFSAPECVVGEEGGLSRENATKTHPVDAAFCASFSGWTNLVVLVLVCIEEFPEKPPPPPPLCFRVVDMCVQ